jgi:hypothetical protein
MELLPVLFYSYLFQFSLALAISHNIPTSNILLDTSITACYLPAPGEGTGGQLKALPELACLCSKHTCLNEGG